MADKRKYTLSEAALAQRRRVSPFSKKKRATEPHIATASDATLQAEILRRFPPLPPGSLTSEHQSRNARIRNYRMSLGLVPNRGGRPRMKTPCARCGHDCETAREAWKHCRESRPRKIVS